MKNSIRGCAVMMAAIGVWTLGACSALTEVNAPDVVQPSSLDSPLGAETIRAGAVAAFANAYGGAGLAREGQVLSSGTLADEFTSSSNSGGDNDLDARRQIDPATTLNYPYVTLQIARVASLQAIPPMQRFAPQAVGKIAQLFAQVGYVELFFAENLCSGVPLSAVDNGQPVYGQPLTTIELLESALRNLDSAAAYARDSARVLNMVRVARGRAHLQAARFTEAAQAVALVPTTYVFVTEFATTQPNGVHRVINTARERGVSDREGGNGLDFRSARDPRVSSVGLGRGSDGITDIFTFERYNSPASAVPLATGIEARLIEAEAALQANPNDASTIGTGWLGILNTLRATAITPAMPPLADPGNFAARVNLLFRERAFWLFGTGHRHGDLRRLVRQYSRAQDQVFPIGAYKGNTLYGSDITFTVPTSEGPNPNWSGRCLNRGA